MHTVDPTFDHAMMARAVHLAARGQGRVEPNPYVGAVLVKNGQILTEGAHRRYGGPHAEASALRRAGTDTARDATLYVTLEPCHHRGKTPPCDRLVAAHGIQRVVIGQVDPNPPARGGLPWLRTAGVETCRLNDAGSRALRSPFAAYLKDDRPFVILKWAMTLDGRIATRHGDSRYITSEAARRVVHQERARADGVVVGSATVLADDPDLTPWLTGGRPAVRVVLDRRLRTPDTAHIVRTARDVPTWIVTGGRPDPGRALALERAGVRLVRVGVREGIHGALRRLRQEGLHRLLVEGGARIASALFQADAVHRVQAFVAPRLLGDDQAPGPLGGGRPMRMAEACALVGVTHRRVGPDLLIEGEPPSRSWSLQAGLLSEKG